MAKCVKMFDGDYKDTVIRVPDKMAFNLVHVEARAVYVPKAEWKLRDARITPKGKV